MGTGTSILEIVSLDEHEQKLFMVAYPFTSNPSKCCFEIYFVPRVSWEIILEFDHSRYQWQQWIVDFLLLLLLLFCKLDVNRKTSINKKDLVCMIARMVLCTWHSIVEIDFCCNSVEPFGFTFCLEWWFKSVLIERIFFLFWSILTAV